MWPILFFSAWLTKVLTDNLSMQVSSTKFFNLCCLTVSLYRVITKISHDVICFMKSGNTLSKVITIRQPGCLICLNHCFLLSRLVHHFFFCPASPVSRDIKWYDNCSRTIIAYKNQQLCYFFKFTLSHPRLV